MKLKGRNVQIAGSLNIKETPEDKLTLVHNFVRILTIRLLDEGARLILDIEPGNPGERYGWSILEAIESVKHKLSSPVAHIITREYHLQKIPVDRQPLLDSLRESGAVKLSATMDASVPIEQARAKQADEADILIAVGGGAGTDHSASLYLANGKPVIPLGLRLMGSNKDGSGASHLAKWAMSKPAVFFGTEDVSQYLPLYSPDPPVNGDSAQKAEKLVHLTFAFITSLPSPPVFLIRLLDPDEKDWYEPVNTYFNEIVKPALDELGYTPVDMADKKLRSNTINSEIFKELHYANGVVADLTGLRPNCLIELGYALVRHKNLITVNGEYHKDNRIPFDLLGMPLHLWNMKQLSGLRIDAFIKDWTEKAYREPPVLPFRRLGWH